VPFQFPYALLEALVTSDLFLDAVTEIAHSEEGVFEREADDPDVPKAIHFKEARKTDNAAFRIANEIGAFIAAEEVVVEKAFFQVRFDDCFLKEHDDNNVKNAGPGYVRVRFILRLR
jgi:O-succinylbenzoate synthase